jgi:hypothetical protein
MMIDRKGSSSEQMASKGRRTNRKEGDKSSMDPEGRACVWVSMSL